MRVITELNESVRFNAPVLTLGTYDGVHVGHQKIIESLIERARSIGSESVLFTFEPHPRKVLYPEGNNVRLIDTVEEKLKKLEKLGLDTVILFPFTHSFSRLSAMEFVRDILVNRIGVKEVHIGYDHHFGKNREGSFHELVELGELYGFSVHQLSAVSVDEITISSTKIRNAIKEGHIQEVTQFLGAPFTISGTVVKGKQLGRTIGFPTANIALTDPDKIIPKNGVYAVQVYWDSHWYNGVMNIGVKPTVSDENQVSLEVYILGFDREIYGERITVRFVQYIRDEKRFDSLDALVNQIKDDEKIAAALLAECLF